jgi:hypothetical protein
MIPSLKALVHDFGLDPGVVFHIYRPVLRHLKPRPTPSEDKTLEVGPAVLHLGRRFPIRTHSVKGRISVESGRFLKNPGVKVRWVTGCA